MKRGAEQAAARVRDPGGPGRSDAGRSRREPAARAGDRSASRHGGDQGQGRHVPGRLLHRQAESAVRAARQDAAREADLSGSVAHHLRRQRLDDGAWRTTSTSRPSRTSRFSTRRRRCSPPTSTTTGTHRGRRRAYVVKHNGALESDHAALPPEGRRRSRARRRRSRPATTTSPPARSSCRRRIARARRSSSWAWSPRRWPSAPTVETVDVDLPRDRDLHDLGEHGEGRLGPAGVRSLRRFHSI